jgi:DNA-binding transcriptional LysR family regulator
MELKHLRTFVAAAEARNFTRAGQALKITQAAVSQHVAALEKECGVSLFDRAARSIALTDAGRQLLDYATRILELVDEAAHAVRGSEPLVAGSLRIATSTIPAEHLLPKLLAEFRDEFPNVRESIVVSDSRVAIQTIEHGDADIGFVGERVESVRLVFTPIAEDQLILAVSPHHPWANKRYVTPPSLSKQPLVVREPGSGSRQCVEQAMLSKGLHLEDMNVVMEVNSNDAIRAAVEQNMGIAFLSSLTASADLERGRIVRVGVRGLKTARQLFMVTDANRSLPRGAVEFARFVELRRGS